MNYWSDLNDRLASSKNYEIKFSALCFNFNLPFSIISVHSSLATYWKGKGKEAKRNLSNFFKLTSNRNEILKKRGKTCPVILITSIDVAKDKVPFLSLILSFETRLLILFYTANIFFWPNELGRDILKNTNRKFRLAYYV